uniref:Uncharacterized protein n=1 Tax=Arundo donax TaxID=35708 RepID=A0A0A9CSV8_ARUDO
MHGNETIYLHNNHLMGSKHYFPCVCEYILYIYIAAA